MQQVERLEVTSDDESDHGEDRFSGGYAVRFLPWRSDEFLQLLMDVDDLVTLNRYDRRDGIGPGSRGRCRYRIAGFMDQRHRTIPYNLPRNCYNLDWVNALTREERARWEKQCEPPMSLAMDAYIKE